MKEPADKRTKEYKDWLESQEPIKEDVGLGDVVELVTKTLGIKKKKGCGCEEKKKEWNKIKLFTRNLKPRCLTDEELKEWDAFRSKQDWKIQGITLTHDKILYIWKTYQDVFNMKVAKPCTNCSPKPIMYMIENIDKLYKESK